MNIYCYFIRMLDSLHTNSRLWLVNKNVKAQVLWRRYLALFIRCLIRLRPITALVSSSAFHWTPRLVVTLNIRFSINTLASQIMIALVNINKVLEIINCWKRDWLYTNRNSNGNLLIYDENDGEYNKHIFSVYQLNCVCI